MQVHHMDKGLVKGELVSRNSMIGVQGSISRSESTRTFCNICFLGGGDLLTVGLKMYLFYKSCTRNLDYYSFYIHYTY